MKKNLCNRPTGENNTCVNDNGTAEPVNATRSNVNITKTDSGATSLCNTALLIITLFNIIFSACICGYVYFKLETIRTEQTAFKAYVEKALSRNVDLIQDIIITYDMKVKK